MRFKGLGIVVFAMAMICAPGVQAGDSEDFSGCDGLLKPKAKDDGMRGQASTSSFSFMFQGSDAKSKIASCNRALANPKLRPTQTLRRAHLLRARAAAHLKSRDFDAALADIDAAQLSVEEYKGEFFFQRSMGVSLDLLRALALHEQGNHEAAAQLAERAAGERPFAIQVQQSAAILRAASLPEGGTFDPLLENLKRIDPSARRLSLSRRKGSPDLEELAASAGELSLTFPAPLSTQSMLGNNSDLTGLLRTWAMPVSEAMLVSYALAATGRHEQARARVEAIRAAIEEQGATNENQFTKAIAGLVTQQTFEPLSDLVEARIAIDENRLADAAELVQGMKLKDGSITRDLYDAYNDVKMQSGQDAPELPALIEASPIRLNNITRIVDSLLLPPETERELIDYKKSRPNILGALVGGAFSLGTSLLGGIERTSGFRSTENDDGTIMVEYTGSTTSGPVVQEMTVLRAAEVASEHGKSHFRVESRKDYQRYLTKTQYGSEISRTLTGYKTELTIRLLDAVEADEDLDAVAVIDRLGPIYY
ncbi:hypothetical protein IM511_05710 [Erythrobacteraceae bacterium E2-1 Yellow Sea]|nr:hypothetical protein [Erythrobacteraceae bacterium E2-1 Yellow Sea]